MPTRELTSPPSLLPAYVKSALPSLPLVRSRGDEIPDLELTLNGVEVDRERLAAYNRVCGFDLRNTLPATYPHILAFPLHMALLADGRFPLRALGLVHIENRITQHRPISAAEPLNLSIRATKLEPHPRGRQFGLVTEARVGEELVWEEVSTTLHRESGGGDSPATTRRSKRREPLPAGAQWRLPGDLGRRYAAVSGDRNPIHLHDLTAKLLGFPRAIAHGMWTKARCLAALESRLPDAFTVQVRFKKPILLPATVTFASEAGEQATRFEVRDAKKDTPHLEGTVA